MQREPLPLAKVLGITELLEIILSFLPISDLLRAQQVSRTFRDTITHSHRLQELLFLRSRDVRDVYAPMPELNTLLAHHVSRRIGFSYRGILYYMSAPQRILVPNPIHLISEKGYGTWHVAISIQDLHPGLVKDTPPLPSVDKGSWQNMYMSNPPCAIHVKVWKTTADGYAEVTEQDPLKRSGDYKGKFVVLGSVNGATFGQMLEQSAVLRNS